MFHGHTLCRSSLWIFMSTVIDSRFNPNEHPNMLVCMFRLTLVSPSINSIHPIVPVYVSTQRIPIRLWVLYGGFSPLNAAEPSDKFLKTFSITHQRLTLKKIFWTKKQTFAQTGQTRRAGMPRVQVINRQTAVLGSRRQSAIVRVVGVDIVPSCAHVL